MKKNQTKTSKTATATTPKQKPRTLEDATSPSATINDMKKALRGLRNTLTTNTKCLNKCLKECMDVIREHDRDIIGLKRDIDNHEVRIDDSVGQNGNLRFMIVTTVILAFLALILAGIAHARINSLKVLLPPTTTYDTTTPFNSTAN